METGQFFFFFFANTKMAYITFGLVDWVGAKVKAFQTLIPWPETAPRRASVNSFGIGGSNAHVIIEKANAEDCSHHTSSYANGTLTAAAAAQEMSRPPHSLVLSASDPDSLEANVKGLCAHLANPDVHVRLGDLAYTLSERRTRLFYRAYASVQTTDLSRSDFTMTKKSPQPPRIGFVFTGQGAQWPEMGKALLAHFPWTRAILDELDQVLQAQPNPPSWSLVSELTGSRTAKHMRQPEIAQPVVTALQLCLVAVLEAWNIRPSSVVGHSSGECAAAHVAGWLDRASALKAAFYRGQAAKNHLEAETEEGTLGMLAVGLNAQQAAPYLEKHAGDVAIACFNSPSSLTISGRKSALGSLATAVQADGHFAREVQVDLAYHSAFMTGIGVEYQRLLEQDGFFAPVDGAASGISWFSSVTGRKQVAPAGASYWNANMISPVRFDDALAEMMTQDSPTVLIEIGPSGALSGPVSQVLKGMSNQEHASYRAAWARGSNPTKSLLDVAGHLWAKGVPIDMAVVNQYQGGERTIVDLPNYSWNHSVKYWYESAASKDWRFRRFPVHDLLGSKVLGTPWSAPVWRNRLNAANVPWIMDHVMGGNAIMPAAGFMAMGVEALYQKHCCALHPSNLLQGPSYGFRNIRFVRALVVESGKDVGLITTLSKVAGRGEWHEFCISSSQGEMVAEHCFGLIRIQPLVDEVVVDRTPLRHPQPPRLWYQTLEEIGMHFGPGFQRILEIEAVSGARKCRTLISMAPPGSAWSPQSRYLLHPAVLDGVLQTPIAANALGERINIRWAMLPVFIEECIINNAPYPLRMAIAEASSVYSGRGRRDLDKSWMANTSVYDRGSGMLVTRIAGLRYAQLDVPAKPDPHTIHRVTWEPDPSLLTKEQMMCLDLRGSADRIHRVIDLIANKKPALAVLEVSLDRQDESCVWLDDGDAQLRSAYSHYDFAVIDDGCLVAAQTRYGTSRNTRFLRVDPLREGLGLEGQPSYGLVIVKMALNDGNEPTVSNLKPLLQPEAFVLVLQPPSRDSAHEVSDGQTELGTPRTPSVAPAESSCSAKDGDPSSVSSAALYHEAADQAITKTCTSQDQWFPMHLDVSGGSPRSASLLMYSRAKGTGQPPRRNLVVACLGDSTAERHDGSSLQTLLEASGWTVTYRKVPIETPEEGDVILVLDEMHHSILRHASEQQWDSIKTIVTSGKPLLWVTRGAQARVTDPDQALVYGMLRAAVREDPSIDYTVLDVQSSTGHATAWAIHKVLGLFAQGVHRETQYIERDGILHIERVLPDMAANRFRRAESEGLEPVVQSFHDNVQVQLRVEHVGTLQSLQWCEGDPGVHGLETNHIEVKVMAAGVNFKDVAIAMGIVPDDEYSIGLECSGIVESLALDVTKFKIGDRVCVLQRGAYTNRLRVHVDFCHAIPDSMSYETAAAIPVVYLCSLYALYRLAALQEGQVRGGGTKFSWRTPGLTLLFLFSLFSYIQQQAVWE